MAPKVSIKEKLAKHEPLRQVQARVEASLVDAWERELAKLKVGKADWMRAAIEAFLEECGAKK